MAPANVPHIFQIARGSLSHSAWRTSFSLRLGVDHSPMGSFPSGSEGLWSARMGKDRLPFYPYRHTVPQSLCGVTPPLLSSDFAEEKSRAVTGYRLSRAGCSLAPRSVSVSLIVIAIDGGEATHFA